MASYIQGVTDIPVPIEPFQPDFGMVQKALSTLQSRYEQGFASVKNAYNSVLNAPITNLKLKAERDAYVKDAELKLKNLSSVDLSLPENQATAEQVFSPFWEDNRMLMDASLTKGYKREIDKGYAARDSTDDKVREQYNDLSMLYLQNGLETLRDTDPNSPEFAKLQPRRWVPFQNLEKYLDERAKDDKLEIKWKSASGPYLIDIRNGQRAKQPFKNWAHNMLGNNFADQFQVMGTVESEQDVKTLMAADPTLTREKALAQLATGLVTQMRKGYTEQDTEISASLQEITAKLKPLLGKNLNADTDKEEIAELQSLDLQRKTLEQQQIDLRKESKKFEDDAPQTLIDVVRSPENYFANLNKQRVVEGWATARASIESMDVDINPAIKESNETAYNMAKLKYDYARLALDTRVADSKMIDTDGDGIKDTWIAGKGNGNGSGGGGGLSGGTTKKGDGSGQTLTSGQNMGAGITDVSQTGSALDVYRKAQYNRLMTANESFLSLDGVARVLTAKLGFEDVDARDFVSAVKDGLKDPDNKTFLTNPAFKPMIEALEKNAGIKLGNGLNARDAMVKVAGDYLAEKLKGGGKGMEKEDRLMVQKYLMGVNALQIYNATEASKQQALEGVFAGTSKFNSLKKTGRDGKVDIMGVDDVAKYFTESSYTFQDKYSDQRFTLTPEQLAQYYVDGKIEEKPTDDPPHWDLVINGERVEQVEKRYRGAEELNSVRNGLQALGDKMNTTLGQSLAGDPFGSYRFKKLNDELNSKVAPNLPEFQSKTGKFGVRLKFDLRSDVDNEFSYRLLSELENGDNRQSIYYDGKPSDSPELDKAVLHLLDQGETSMEKFISAIHIDTTGPHGNPMVEFSVVPVKDSDKTDVTDDVQLKELAKKGKIAIELNPNASGALTRSIRFNSGFYMFGDLLKGKEMRSDPVLEAAGFKFSVLPDDAKNPTSATITMERTVFDDKTGQNKPLKKWKSDPIDFSNRTPDEIMGYIYQYLNSHLQENEAANERYEANQTGNTKTGREWLKY
jgi:hypothetical protein